MALAVTIACAGAAACGSAPTGFGSDGSEGGGTGTNGVDPGGSGDGGGSGNDGGGTSGGSDGSTGTKGSSDGGGLLLPDAAIYDTPTVCTSGTMWTLGDQKSSDMEPGLDCATCHVLGGEASGKQFDISGTVYPTAHEPDNCYGATGATVVITDVNGGTTNLTVSASGNFEHDDAVGFFKIATPYTALVKVGSSTREMLTPQTDGNCNDCHSLDGANDAPGRVMMP
ncbi:MAG: hypothetical protein ACRELY_23830 [Polyangiaceae bacterium]